MMSILFITTSEHSYTLDGYLKSPHRRAAARVISYDSLSRRRLITAATVIFTDLERLRHHELEFAGRMFQQLAAAGMRTLNDPGRVAQRAELLYRLHAAGINRFRAWPAALDPRPTRFPVFFKCAAGHDQHVDSLLGDQDALERELARLRATSFPLTHMLVIEFANEALRPGVWRRHAMYRIASTLVPAAVVTESSPFVKSGTKHLANEAENAASVAEIAENPYARPLEHAFDLAGIDFGRADFGFDGGSPAIYEINTNPSIPRRAGSAHPGLAAATMELTKRVVEAIDAIDGTDRTVSLKHRRRFLLRHNFSPLPRMKLP